MTDRTKGPRLVNGEARQDPPPGDRWSDRRLGRIRGPAARRPPNAIVVLGVSLLALVACGDRGEGTTAAVGARPPTGRTVRAAPVSTSPTTASPVVSDTSGYPDQASGTAGISRLPVPTAETEAPRPVTYGEAEDAYRRGDYEEAFELFGVYCARKPENPWGHYMLGLSAWKAGLHEEAERALETSLSLDPLHVKSLVNLGRVLVEVGRPEEAEGYLLTARELDPSADVHRVLGRAHHEMGDLDGAIDDYRSALVVDGEDAWSMNNLGLALIQEGRYDEALGPLARATRIRDDVAVFQNNLGLALERTGHPGSALLAFRAAVELDGSYEKASISLERVSALPGVDESEPMDLETVARSFADEVEGWRRAFEAVGEPDGLEEPPSGEETRPDSQDGKPVTGEPPGVPPMAAEVLADSTPRGLSRS
jgi:Flp pilus assembly protein TadD